MRLAIFGVLCGLTLSVPALAEGSGPRIRAGEGIGGLLSEFRVGGLWHDLGAKESSAALNGEILFVSPVPGRLTAGTDPVWRWLLEPRPHLGFTANLEGKTNKGYAGLTWTAMVARDVWRPGDGVRFGILLGGSVNDGKHDSRLSDRKDLGGNLLFHVGAEVGYQVDRNLSVSVFIDHDSNGGTANRNQGLNSLGLRLGYAL